MLITLSFFMSGCFVKSLYPLYTEKDIIFDEALCGEWMEENENNKTIWKFVKDEDGKSYKLTHTDEDGNKAGFSVHLVKLGKYKFIDIYLVDLMESSKSVNHLAVLHLAPTHTFARVDEIGDKLRIRWFNLEWMENLLKTNPDTIEHYRFLTNNKDDYVFMLTAKTDKLQSFILKNAEGDAFKNEYVLVKKK